MSIVRVHNFSVSLDGFATGEGQSFEAPFGHADRRLLEWALSTRTSHQMHGESGGTTGADESFANNWARGIGAEIMGRNKFGPQRGPWENEEWKGWWGIDQMHLVIVPIVLGRGERLWDGLEELERRFDVEAVCTPSGVVHLMFTRR